MRKKKALSLKILSNFIDSSWITKTQVVTPEHELPLEGQSFGFSYTIGT